ncbi:hypothetical protein AAFF_G00073100 [Aldrovandia affinis]|uniref:Uncharacterized protein n=1 Tax=Aldrovandia affinis TaxID=143900 RepID=A0AAD7WD16_9TELE|nr:hypothetical protein AAFF_G00073100 [Aldrovandia affinis]
MRMEAIGFIAYLVQNVLMLLDAPNKLLQGEDMDLLTGLELVASATERVGKLRCEAEFTELWNRVPIAAQCRGTMGRLRRFCSPTVNVTVDLLAASSPGFVGVGGGAGLDVGQRAGGGL